MRLPDWPERLAAYLAVRERTPFEYGVNDCVLFAAGAVEAMTGVRPALPRWRTQRQAAALLLRRGGILEATAAVLPACPLGLAQRGDLAVCEAVDGPALLVIEGATLIGPGASGLTRWPRAAAYAAFRVE